MLKKLGKSDIEQLRSHLIVPLAIADILYHDLEVEPDMQYGLHMALSEIDPDSALLAIALAATDIAEKNMIYAPIASALMTEAENIIAEYGPTWLHHHLQGPMPEDVYMDVLKTVPEDLEALADLMDALCADLGCVDEATPILSNLMSVQARAHMEIAEFILSESERDIEERIEFTMDFMDEGEIDEGKTTQHIAHTQGSNTDNIIMFPTGKSA
jgi:hypothetical protein